MDTRQVIARFEAERQGLANSFVLADDGTTFAFGSNASLQSGFPDTSDRNIATAIDTTNLGGLAVTSIAGRRAAPRAAICIWQNRLILGDLRGFDAASENR
jgi:hypothetical protein